MWPPKKIQPSKKSGEHTVNSTVNCKNSYERRQRRPTTPGLLLFPPTVLLYGKRTTSQSVPRLARCWRKQSTSSGETIFCFPTQKIPMIGDLQPQSPVEVGLQLNPKEGIVLINIELQGKASHAAAYVRKLVAAYMEG